MEKADDEELDAAIAEEETEEQCAEEESVYASGMAENDDGDETETIIPFPDSDSETLRAIEEENIIKTYLGSTTTVDSVYPPTRSHSIYGTSHRRVEKEKMKQAFTGYLAHKGEKEDQAAKQARDKRSSDFARSYRNLVGRAPASQTTLQFERFPEADVRGPELRAVDGWI